MVLSVSTQDASLSVNIIHKMFINANHSETVLLENIQMSAKKKVNKEYNESLLTAHIISAIFLPDITYN